MQAGLTDPLRELWVVGLCWTVAIFAHVFGVSEELILPLVALGIVTGLAEWYLRRKPIDLGAIVD